MTLKICATYLILREMTMDKKASLVMKADAEIAEFEEMLSKF